MVAGGDAVPDIHATASASIQADDELDAGVPAGGGADAGVSDAGESLPGGVPPTEEELAEAHLRDTAPAGLMDDELGPALELAERIGNPQRAAELLAQIRDRGDTDYSFGTGLPLALPRGAAGNAMVTPQVALAILRGLAERRMWERVAAQVRASASKVGEVILPPGGRFSNNPGRFTVIADAAKIRLRGGPLPLLEAIRNSGAASPVPALAESAEELARSMRLAGRVRQVFRVGGRILIVVAIAVDSYEIITAEDHLEATLVSLSGWAGASAAAAAFSALWTPADVAGPWAWAGHGVGVLVSGGIGYWLGSSATRYVYRLVVNQRGQVRAQ